MAILACTPNEYAFSCLDSALVSEICLLLILLLETCVDALWLQCHSYSSEMQQERSMQDTSRYEKLLQGDTFPKRFANLKRQGMKNNYIVFFDETASGLGQILSTGINQRLLIDESRVTVAERVYSLKPFLIAEKALKLLIGWILCKNVAARKLPLAFFQLSCSGSESKTKSLSLLSSGKTSVPRSGLSFRLSSAHWSASFAKHKVSSIGQSGTSESTISLSVSFSIACSTISSGNKPGQCNITNLTDQNVSWLEITVNQWLWLGLMEKKQTCGYLGRNSEPDLPRKSWGIPSLADTTRIPYSGQAPRSSTMFGCRIKLSTSTCKFWLPVKQLDFYTVAIDELESVTTRYKFRRLHVVFFLAFSDSGLC
uniref:Uncharacterized protein n=1 Tax=Salix viminalis TaxID=40686 RepID=A0A6N2NK31_SALVM